MAYSNAHKIPFSTALLLKCTLFLNLFISIPTAIAQLPKSETYTICSAPSFAYAAPCATCCLGHCDLCSPPDVLTNAVSCTVNSCLCRREAIRTAASSHIQSCILESCNGDVEEVSLGLKLYNDYCATYLGEALTSAVDSGVVSSITIFTNLPSEITQTATISTVSTLPDGSVVSKVFTSEDFVPVATVTEISFQSSGDDGLKTSDKIALGLGLGIGIPIALGLAFCGYLLWRKRVETQPVVNVGGIQSTNTKA